MGGPRSSLGAKSAKKAGTAAEEYGRRRSTMGYSSPGSVKTFSDYGGEESLEVVHRDEIPDGLGGDEDDEYEGLENVRACCGGKHDGKLLNSLPHLLCTDPSPALISR